MILEKLNAAEKLLVEGRLEEALQITKELKKKEQLPKDDLLNSLILKSKILLELRRAEEALKLVDQILERRQDLGPFQDIDAFLLKAEALCELDRLDESLEVLSLSEIVHQKLPKGQSNEIIRRKAYSMHIKSKIHLTQSDMKQALKLQKQSYSLFIKSDDKFGTAKSLTNLGIIYWYKGEFNKALEYYEESRSLNKEIGNIRGVASCLNNIAAIYGSKGELNQALEYFLQGLKLREDVGDTESFGIADILNNIGILYLHKGELNLSLDYYEKSLKMKKKLGANKQKVAESLHNMGIVYMHQGKIDQAFEYLNQSLSLFNEIGHRLLMAHSLLDLVIVSLDKASLKMANRYLERLEEINKLEKNKVVSQQYRVAKAIILRTSNRSRDRVEAEEILKQVIEEEIVSYEVSILAMLHLCELILFELRITNDLDILRELQTLTEKILHIAKKQESYWLLAEVYVIKSKLKLLELDLQETQHYLDLAQLMAEERGMQRLTTKILNEKHTFQQQMSNWQYFASKNTPVKERLDLVQLESLIMDLARKRLDVTEEDVLDYAQIAHDIKQQWIDA